MAKSHLLQHVASRFCCCPLRRALNQLRDHHIFLHGQGRNQVELLKNKAHIAGTKTVQLVGIQLLHLMPKHTNMPRIRVQSASNNA